MNIQEQILKAELREQIALEEDLCRKFESQISEIESDEFLDAKELLTNASKVLEGHYNKLNELLDTLEIEDSNGHRTAVVTVSDSIETADKNLRQKRNISKILRDDYSALNLVTISNTILHTTALALDNSAVADVSLQHLANLAPYVVRVGELVPRVLARELRSQSLGVDMAVAEAALVNVKLAWRKAK
ncbi:MAG: hypothetical protein PHC51_13355 [bacterium]|nr:hypothetical protein [bacterium]